MSALPDGTYRTEILLPDVEQAGVSNDDGWTGTWTLEVDKGVYEVKCKPLDLPGKDCGNSPVESTFEAGHLNGTGDTVSFVSDPQLLAKLSGCKLPPGDAGTVRPQPYLHHEVGGRRRPADLHEPDPQHTVWNGSSKPLQKIG